MLFAPSVQWRYWFRAVNYEKLDFCEFLMLFDFETFGSEIIRLSSVIINSNNFKIFVWK